MRHILFPFLLAIGAVSGATHAQENGELGRMWTFENPPLAYLEAEYGFRPDQAWLDKVRMASLRFGQGCSASFVSPKGLIMTNHHCVRGDIARVQGENDWVKDGFVASSYDTEVPLTGLTVQQLVATRDVTDAIREGVEADDDDATVAAKREANGARLLESMQAEYAGRSLELVDLFQGAMSKLYVYRVFDDVRLVVAPHLQTAHFGGDFDNFTYPRYGIDFSFVRAYENGAPVDTSDNFFRWSDDGAKPGELVFVTGNPGSTSRLLTRAQFEMERDGNHAYVLQLLDNRIEILEAFAGDDPERQKRVRTTLLSWQNAQKAYRGGLGGLRDPEYMANKARAERAFRERIAADPALEEKYGGLWDEIAEVAAARTALEGPANFHSGGGSPHVEKALAVVRAVDAATAGDERAGQLATRAKNMPVRYDPLTEQFVTDHFARSVDWLPAHDPFRMLTMSGRTPLEAAQWLADSRITDTDYVVELLAGGFEAVLASEDPAVMVARFVARRGAANAAAVERLEERAKALGAKIGRALFDAYGEQVSPDATFTLRISDGVVKGYEFNGTLAPWRTSFYGMYARNAEFGDKYPFDLPQVWKDRMDRVDMSKSVDFVCTVDSTGGNSGSPVIDRNAEIVGLLFDGNIESLRNDFVFDDTSARSVCVHVDSILESLVKIYDAQWVADELQAAGKQ